MVDYSKRALTFEEQVELLRSRGLKIENEERTIRHLSRISYYRLSAYMLPFKELKDEKYLDKFIENATWESIYDLYVLDRKLRIVVFDAIERIEVAVRTQMVYTLSHKYGAHWLDNNSVINEPRVYNEIQTFIEGIERKKENEVFIEHYYSKYDNPEHPPCWMLVELLYFRHLSVIFKSLARKDRNNISMYFKLPEDIFKSWLHTLNLIRNTCAHHARLWNKNLAITPKIFINKNKDLEWIDKSIIDDNAIDPQKVYYTLRIIDYLLQATNPSSKFRERVSAIFNEYRSKHDQINIYKRLGVPMEHENIFVF